MLFINSLAILHCILSAWLQDVDKRLMCDCAVAAELVELHRAMIVLRWLEWRRHMAVVRQCTALKLHCMTAHVHHTMGQRHLPMMVQQHQAAPVHGILPTPTLHLGECFFDWTDCYCDCNCYIKDIDEVWGQGILLCTFCFGAFQLSFQVLRSTDTITSLRCRFKLHFCYCSISLCSFWYKHRFTNTTLYTCY